MSFVPKISSTKAFSWVLHMSIACIHRVICVQKFGHEWLILRTTLFLYHQTGVNAWIFAIFHHMWGKDTRGNLFSKFCNNWTSTILIFWFLSQVMNFIVFVPNCWPQNCPFCTVHNLMKPQMIFENFFSLLQSAPKVISKFEQNSSYWATYPGSVDTCFLTYELWPTKEFCMGQSLVLLKSSMLVQVEHFYRKHT